MRRKVRVTPKRRQIDPKKLVLVMYEMKCDSCPESQWVWLRDQKEFDAWRCECGGKAQAPVKEPETEPEDGDEEETVEDEDDD